MLKFGKLKAIILVHNDWLYDERRMQDEHGGEKGVQLRFHRRNNAHVIAPKSTPRQNTRT